MEDLYNKASLVLTPQMVEAGKVYSMKPEDRKGDFTFSRSTAATRVNASGNIEKETGNLLVQSNQFDTSWEKSDVTITSGFVGYDGTNNAWELTRTATAYARMNQAVTQSGVYAHSIYAKAGTLNWISIGPTGGGEGTWFNLSNGTIGIEGSLIKHSSIESVGNGWYRISIVVNNPGNQWFRFYPSDVDGGDESATATGTIYVQDAQLEQGLVARDVITTTTTAIYGGITDNVPRLDYTDSSCPALLLEPQRTNQVENSEYYESYAFSRVSISSNATASPEGSLNASELVEDLTNENHFFRIPNLSFTSGTDVVFSIYLKENTRRYSRLRFDNTGGNTRVWLDLRTGEVTFIDNTDNGVCTSTDVGNGWFRYEFKVTPSNTGTGSVQIFTQSVESVLGSLQTTYQGDGSSGIYVYGAQVEAGSYATSYIPTYGSAVTRNEDNTTITNLQSNNIAGDTFSYFFEWGDYVADRNFEIRDSSNTNFFFMVSRLFRYNNESGGVDSLMILPTSGTALKCMVTYDGTTLKGFVNGAVEGSVTDAKASQFSDFNYLRLDRDHPDSEELRSLMIFPTALTDQEAIDLTTI